MSCPDPHIVRSLYIYYANSFVLYISNLAWVLQTNICYVNFPRSRSFVSISWSKRPEWKESENKSIFNGPELIRRRAKDDSFTSTSKILSRLAFLSVYVPVNSGKSYHVVKFQLNPIAPLIHNAFSKKILDSS